MMPQSGSESLMSSLNEGIGSESESIFRNSNLSSRGQPRPMTPVAKAAKTKLHQIRRARISQATVELSNASPLPKTPLLPMRAQDHQSGAIFLVLKALLIASSPEVQRPGNLLPRWRIPSLL